MHVHTAKCALSYVSVSADKSFLQEEYSKTFTNMCEKYGVAQPFELDDARLSEFFGEITAAWKVRKRELYKEGKLTADQL